MENAHQGMLIVFPGHQVSVKEPFVAFAKNFARSRLFGIGDDASSRVKGKWTGSTTFLKREKNSRK